MQSIIRSPTFRRNVFRKAPFQLLESSGKSQACRRLACQLSSVRELYAPIRSPASLVDSIIAPSPLSRSSRLRCAVASCPIHSRQLHGSRAALQESKPSEKATKPTSADTDPKTAEARADSERRDSDHSEAREDGDETQNKEEGGKEKEDLPPPPPHGDKTPWQVFMETMNTEFQASKEWNESTKQIGAAAHQFSESESVRRAREAYEKSTGAISTTTAKAVKSTAGAIGKGAAWTWETPVMKGVRKAANVTGDAVDKATKPIRETEAYRNVRNVIDDGSSSRYGGWVEKEERRKKRAMLERQNPATNQALDEDPK